MPWDQYRSISCALVKTTSLETCVQLFNTAKVLLSCLDRPNKLFFQQNIDENLEFLPSSFEPVVKIIMKNIIVCKVLSSPVGKLKKLSIVEQTGGYPLFTLL